MKKFIILMIVIFSLKAYSKIHMVSTISFVLDNNIITNHELSSHANMLMFFKKNNPSLLDEKIKKNAAKDIMMAKIETAAAVLNELDDKDRPENMFYLIFYKNKKRNIKKMNRLFTMFMLYNVNQDNMLNYMNERFMGMKLKKKLLEPKLFITKNDIKKHQKLVNVKHYYKDKNLYLIKIKIKSRDKYKNRDRILYTKYLLEQSHKNFKFYSKMLSENLDFKVKKVNVGADRKSAKIVRRLNKNENIFINENLIGPIYKNNNIVFYKIISSLPTYKNKMKFKIKHYFIKKDTKQNIQKYKPYDILCAIDINAKLENLNNYNFEIEKKWVTKRDTLYRTVQEIYFNKQEKIYEDKDGWHLIVVKKQTLLRDSIKRQKIKNCVRKTQFLKLKKVLHKVFRANVYLLK